MPNLCVEINSPAKRNHRGGSRGGRAEGQPLILSEPWFRNRSRPEFGLIAVKRGRSAGALERLLMHSA